MNRLFPKSVLTALVSAAVVLVTSIGTAHAGNPGALSSIWDGGVIINDGAGNGLGGGGLPRPLICRHLYFEIPPVQLVATAASGSQVAAGSVVAEGAISSPVTGESTGNVLGGCGASDPDPHGENLLSGAGTVHGFAIYPALTAVGAISGSCRGGPSGTAGTYARIGGAVIYSLRCNEVVTGPTGVSSTDNLEVTIVEARYPDNLNENGFTNSFRHFTFVGTLIGAGTS